MSNPKESKKRDKRTEIIALRLFPAERNVWEEAAEKEHKDLADFIRTKINDYILRKETTKVDVDLGPIMQELKDLEHLINTRDDLIDINRQFLIENAATLKINDATIEEKILSHIGNRSLYTTQIVEYLQEDAEVIITVLAQMEKKQLINQNKQKRWSKNE